MPNIDLNIDHAKDSGKRTCADCGVEITPENYSGWDAFVGPMTTQPLCKQCDYLRSIEPSQKKGVGPH